MPWIKKGNFFVGQIDYSTKNAVSVFRPETISKVDTNNFSYSQNGQRRRRGGEVHSGFTALPYQKNPNETKQRKCFCLVIRTLTTDVEDRDSNPCSGRYVMEFFELKFQKRITISISI